MIPRQPTEMYGANSGREVDLEDERRASISKCPPLCKGFFIIRDRRFLYYDNDFYEVTKIFVYVRISD